MLWISEAFGPEYGMHLVISLAGFLEQFLCTLLFNIRTRKRSAFHLWVLFFAFVGLFLSFILAGIRLTLNDYPIAKSAFHAVFTAGYMFLMVFFLYDKTVYQKLLTFCSTNATAMLVNRLFSLALNICGVNDKVSMSFFPEYNAYRDWSLYFLIHVLLYLLVGLIFYTRKDIVETRTSKRNILILSIISVLLTNFLFSFSDPYQTESWTLTIIIKVFACIISIMILTLRTGILFQSQEEEEKFVLTQIFRQEKEQFDNLRLSTDVINAKCHDLHHRLDEIGDRLTKDELSSFKEATRIYDSTIKTGLDVLDAILYEKKLLCNTKKIRLSALCDGRLLSFMDPTDVYSLVGNALSNAIEAVSTLPEEKRIIDCTLRMDYGLAILDITNFFQGKVHLGEDGLPLSSKGDGSNHGYGSKSIRFIVEKHHGTLTYKIQDHLFTLVAAFDTKKAEKK